VSARFAAGARVRVLPLFPPGHVRTPWFLRGKEGRVTDLLGAFADPEELAYGRPGRPTPLYRVRFDQRHVWPDYQGTADDTIVADLYEHWLEASGDER
jgi:nitrile hydratase subunit beta